MKQGHGLEPGIGLESEAPMDGGSMAAVAESSERNPPSLTLLGLSALGIVVGDTVQSYCQPMKSARTGAAARTRATNETSEIRRIFRHP